MDIIDTHLHLWDLSRHTHAWCAAIPTLNRSFLPGDYAAAAAGLPDGTRIAGAIFVECDVDPAQMASETRWALAMANDPLLLTAGVVAACRPETPEKQFRIHLDQFAGEIKLKGVRRVLHTQPDELPQSSLFANNIRSLRAYGLTFDLCILPRQLPSATKLARACPDVHFVLDHCGIPDVKNRALDPWRRDLQELANEPNVIGCKISGLVAYADPNHPPSTDNLHPFVEHTIETFGCDRLLFGGDWPVCTLSADGPDALSRWIGLLQQLIAGANIAQQEQLWRTNAQRVYRLS